MFLKIFSLILGCHSLENQRVGTTSKILYYNIYYHVFEYCSCGHCAFVKILLLLLSRFVITVCVSQISNYI